MKYNSLKNKLALFLIFSLNFLSINLFAIERTDSAHLKDTLPSDCIFSGDFTQSRKIKALPQPLLSSGKLFFSCEHGLIWHNEVPFSESLIYTSAGMHFRNLPNHELAPLDGQQHYHLANLLISLLSADTDKIEKDFSIGLNKQSSNTTIELLPTNSFIKKGLNSISIKKIFNNQEETLSIAINKTKEQITTLSITNLTSYKKNETDEIRTKCNEVILTNQSCSILATPYHYQLIDNH